MRLTDHQLTAICKTFKEHFLENDKIWLFGSRVDPLKKGGDIDLYIETTYPETLALVEKKIAFLRELKKKIGDQKIDIVVCSLESNQHLPIYDEAKNTGIQIL